MGADIIVRLIDEMSTFARPFFFSPFKVNEPFLDKRLISYLHYFNEKCSNGKLRLFTNGSPLGTKLIGEIQELRNVEHVWISLNECDAHEYYKTMHLWFAQTIARMDELHSFVEAGQFTHPVIVSKVADDNTEHNLKFVQFCSQRWPRFTPRVIKRDGWLGFVEPGNAFIPDQPCARWFELSVMATGKVALCCMDGTGEYAIGDVCDSTLLDVYNAPQWRERRLRTISRKVYEPCKRCTY